MSHKRFNSGGGIINDGQWVFVMRPEFHIALKYLETAKGVSIQAARQVGKTTTMNYLQDAVEKNGGATSWLDMSMFFGRTEAELSEWILKKLLDEIPLEASNAVQLHVSEGLPKFLRSVIQARSDLGHNEPWVVFLDEMDSIVRLPARDVMRFMMLWRAALEREHGLLKLVTASVYSLNELFADANDTGNGMNNLPELRLPFWGNDALTLGMLAQGFPPEMPVTEVQTVLADVIHHTAGHPGAVSTLCLHLTELAQSNSLPLPLRWLDLRSRLLDPYRGQDPMAGYMTGLQTQLAALRRDFYACRSVLLRVMRCETSGHWDKTAVARLMHMGLIRLQEDQTPCWAAEMLAQRIDERWLEGIDERVTALLGEAIARPTNIALASGRRRVLLLTMGGTIGMGKGEDGNTVSFQGMDMVLREFSRSEAIGLADVETQTVALLNGIDVTPDHWVELAHRIHLERNRFDAFVITHGTDTLAYTASALAYMLGPAFGKPVVFTGAQTTSDVVWGDVRTNLSRAVLAATVTLAIPEVQIVFGDQVLRATRAVKEDDRLFQAFGSPAAPPLARITEGFLRSESWVPLPGANGAYEFLPYKADDILFISLAPGVGPQRWRRAIEAGEESGQQVQGVIISTPGAGSLPSQGNYNFRPFIEWAVGRDIPVLILGQMPINAYALQQYEVSTAGTLAGGIPAGNMSLPAAYTKFSWAIGRARYEVLQGHIRSDALLKRVKALMLEPYVGEQDVETQSAIPYQTQPAQCEPADEVQP